MVRVVIAMAWGLALGWSAPPLATIQDMLYKADGSRFNGFLLIEWRGVEAYDSSQIATHNVTSQIISGVLRVKLVPNAANTSYSVRYVSDGKVQFQETWFVPVSVGVLRLNDVRVATVPGGGGGTPGEVTQVNEADVIGLVADLAIRPVKGAGYAASRALYADAAGAIQAVVGNLSDCARVDGTAGACGAGGSSGPGFVDAETPAGAIDGSNASFTLAAIPSPSTSLSLYRNGLLQREEIDYTLTDTTVTFTAGSLPQAGDTLVASYRLAHPGNLVGEAGGALRGYYPSPDLALGVIVDANVADTAGIRESKLTLNYATHSSANDPTSGQKAALAGTSGSPSATNRFVTSYHSRLSDSRPPAPHNLLGSGHIDTGADTMARGDLLSAQGTPPTWARLPLGVAGRCLASTGSDAAWGACLYTGFTTGAVPCVDASGSLSQNAARLAWDNANRKLSVGNAVGAATLYIFDSAASTGVTTLGVRAGQNQGPVPLVRWLDGADGELGRIDPDGSVAASSFRSATSGARARWRDSGSPADPGTRAEGDAWFHTGALARKTYEGGQIHVVPQVLCSRTGTGPNSTSLVLLGTCTIPAGLLKQGDRVEIRFDYSHEGAATAPEFQVTWGATTLVSRSGNVSDTVLTGRASAAIHATGTQWSLESWGGTLSYAATAGAASDSPAAPLTIGWQGRMLGATSETVTLRGFTVVRNPAQSNP